MGTIKLNPRCINVAFMTKQKKPVKKPKAIIKIKTKEVGGPKGPEPTRYGDWEKGGRCSDF